jgi:dTDP-4-dehydrorhamnose 3,5-epimerase-like enzyme
MDRIENDCIRGIHRQVEDDLMSLLTKIKGHNADRWRHTDRQQGNFISLLLFFQNKENSVTIQLFALQ